ncbi:OadG family protein [Spongorhabdus nitratireducens]
MSSADLMGEGLNLMLFGMGFVFVFLTMLVIVTSFMSRIVQATQPEQPQTTGGNNMPATPITGAADPASDPVLLGIIGDAIKQHRIKQGRS